MFPHGSQTTGVTPSCDKNLLIATQSNVNLLADFVQSAPVSNSMCTILVHVSFQSAR